MADPVFLTPQTNPFGLTDVGAFSAPTFADIDGDGDFDAFMSESTGNMKFFLNTGSASSPAFATVSNNPFGLTDVGTYGVPTFADIDADGDLDAFIGETSGNTYFFLNTGTATNPAFASVSTNPFGISDIGTYSAPSFADIDADGDLDYFSGSQNGNTIFFQNTGSPSSPAFAAASTNPFGHGFLIKN